MFSMVASVQLSNPGQHQTTAETMQNLLNFEPALAMSIAYHMQ